MRAHSSRGHEIRFGIPNAESALGAARPQPSHGGLADDGRRRDVARVLAGVPRNLLEGFTGPNENRSEAHGPNIVADTDEFGYGVGVRRLDLVD